MTVGYFNASALVAVLSAGAIGEQGVAVWKALGAPPHVAVDVAIVERIGADHFVTTSDVAMSWATIRCLDAMLLSWWPMSRQHHSSQGLYVKVAER